MKRVASIWGIGLSATDDDLRKLYDSVDLTGKLVIFEDVERTQIGILDFLGYVNNLTEQDGVKVLLVTNETEFIHCKPINVVDEKDRKRAELLARITEKDQDYTEETQKYLEIKEKTVGDTIQFAGDIKTAAKQIVRRFDNDLLASFANDVTAGDLRDIMALLGSSNLRSIVFACQKTVEIFEKIPKGNEFTEDFFRTILYGIVAFSIRMNNGKRTKWIGMDHYSFELGASKHPLFRFCYDYIMTQQLDETQLPVAARALEHLRLYDEHKTRSDPDLQKISGYYRFSESDVREAVQHITERLHNPGDISFYDYGRLAVGLIEVAYRLGIDISDAKESLVRNLQGRGTDIPQEKVFGYFIPKEDPEMGEEFAILRASMIESLNYKSSAISDFDYQPENANQFYHLVINHDKQFYEQRCFAKQLDIPLLIDMFIAASAAQMDDIRRAFSSLYERSGSEQYLCEDADAIGSLLQGLSEKRDSAILEAKLDKVQRFQYDWFIKDLETILTKLKS